LRYRDIRCHPVSFGIRFTRLKKFSYRTLPIAVETKGTEFSRVLNDINEETG
jgi:hypothetical protein